MTSHVEDEIPGMLRGDLARKESLTAAAHLRVCSDCRDELISALVSHIALMSTARLFRETESIGNEIADRELSSLVPDAPVSIVSSRDGRRRGLAAAAVTVLAAAGVAGVLLSPGSASQSVSLSAYGVGTSTATAKFVDSDHLDLEANLPPLAGGSYYEMWLTNASRTVMTPIGQLASSGSTQLRLSRDVVSLFADIEVSVQSSANGSAYSGVSVLRGHFKSA